jgi:hypothetical protein
MIVAMLGVYLVLLFALVKFGVVRWLAPVSPFIVLYCSISVCSFRWGGARRRGRSCSCGWSRSFVDEVISSSGEQ